MAESTEYAASLLDALEYAAEMHRDQRRKGAEASPYINHPIKVARVLATVGGVYDLPTLMAAVLHDTIEDTRTSKEDLVERFGAEVAGLVVEVSDDKSLPKAERKQKQVEHAPHLSERAKLIKIADKICNVTDIAEKPPADWDVERRRRYFDWATAVVDGCRGVNADLETCFAEAVAKSAASVDAESA